MILEVIKYGHPVLRDKGKRIEKVTPDLRKFADDMLETMRANNGVGLAAQQVGRALQILVLDVRITDRPSQLFVEGQQKSLEDFMPMVLLNPIVQQIGEDKVVNESEGCLSFPDINGDITRSRMVAVEAINLEGQQFRFECSGLLALAVQHEVDHLNGILFIDRMDAAIRASLSGKLKRLQKETRTAYARAALSDVAK